MGQIQNPLHATPHGAGVANGRAAMFALQRQLAQALQRAAAGVARVAAGVLNGLRGIVRRRQLTAVPSGEARAGVGARIRMPLHEPCSTIFVRPMMADFAAQRCELHPQIGPVIVCEWADGLADEIQANLRKWVYATGAAERDPKTLLITRFKMESIEALDPATEILPGADHPDAGKSFEQLAAEQGVKLPQNIDEILGSGRDLWDSDEDFEEFLEYIYRDRRAGRERARREFAEEQQ